ncbi:hypothetical protein F0562_002250 [Nyssa sinensis]|uniref:DUF506 domain-containing protein n=1 Tax=Nyssa sinensis TaxID=561372 RepID=A0A5J5C6G3_9ASTE|nr:hypothetical protein F0562_002250 [Nyssa sinensis]
MASSARIKRVTDPLDDKVKSRIVGRDRCEPVYVSSGSEHGGENDDESPCLSELVYGFLEDDGAGAQSLEKESGYERDTSMSETDLIEDLKYLMLTDYVDSFKNVVAAHVSNAMVVFSFVKTNKPVFRRNVMAFLRDCGYDAAICKTNWESSGGLTAGNYEFIDVVRSDSASTQHRYFIDLDFAEQFEIARPTNQYESLLEALPGFFVGKSEDLKKIVKFMSNAAKRSLKSRGLHLPPWRKNRFMQNKWFGPYRRTLNVIPTTSLSCAPPANPTFAAQCRSVGIFVTVTWQYSLIFFFTTFDVAYDGKT